MLQNRKVYKYLKYTKYMKATKSEETRNTKLRLSTRKELRRIGIMGESFDDVIQRILKMHKRGDNKIKKPSEIEDKMDSSLRKK